MQICWTWLCGHVLDFISQKDWTGTGQKTCCVQVLSYHDKVFWVYKKLVKSHYTFLSRVAGNTILSCSCSKKKKEPRACGKASTSFRKSKVNYQVNFTICTVLLESQAFTQCCTSWNQFCTCGLELMSHTGANAQNFTKRLHSFKVRYVGYVLGIY